MSSNTIIRISDQEEYSLGDCLGRGAFGSVYRGLNTSSGETVAIKQIKLRSLQHTDAREIMSEIDLLKNLKHPNIVKYNCFYKSSDSLFLVLEYCENGSLSSICKSFGVFPEHLIAVYIDQVLQGLVYLHDQGVIHRDIKGANILTTKDGVVKLADFGVATSALSDLTVVGSPYWMAPEIIELAGATSASDIWSLGCVIIELLQGHPPYSDLDQMAALFHIVDDEHPPFPDSASPGAKDFLIRCFQKDPNLRTSARKLRKHNWIVNNVKRGSQKLAIPTKTIPVGFDDAMISVQEYNHKINGPDIILGEKSTRHLRNSTNKQVLRPGAKQDQISKHVEKGIEDWSQDLELDSGNNFRQAPLQLRRTKKMNLLPSAKSIKAVGSRDWDDDFDVSIAGRLPSPQKPAKSQSPIRSKHRNSTGNEALRQRPGSVPAVPHSSVHEKTSSNELTINAPALRSPNKVLSNGKRFENHGGLIHDTAKAALTGRDLTPRKLPRGLTDPHTEHDRRSALALQHFAETSESYDDIFGEQLSLNSSHKSHSSQPSNRSWLQDDDNGEDPFADIEEFAQENLATNVAREQKARASQQIEQLLKDFQSQACDDAELTSCIREILTVLTDHPDLRSVIIAAHGLLPLLESLEKDSNDELVLSVLQLLNCLAADDFEVLENISFVGGISSVAKYAYKKYDQDIRIQAAIFVRHLLASSDLNAQMFVSCRGLAILTEFLEEDYHDSGILVMTGIEGILRILALQGRYTPRNDLYRIMAQAGVFEPLTHTLHILVIGLQGDEDTSAIASILDIMLAFGQADEHVKLLIASEVILRRIFMDLRSLHGAHLISALKFIRSLCTVPIILKSLVAANAIERLVQLLNDNNGPHEQECANQVIPILFNLCRIEKSRLDEAASVGLIPVLQNIISDEKPLKDMALPMLCNMSHNKQCRRFLWSFRGLEFYIKILGDPLWQHSSFEAIVVWFFEEPARVERVLIEQPSISAIIKAFSTARAAPFESLLDQLQKLLKSSVRISRAIANESFVSVLLQRLDHPKPTVRANILKIMQSILQASLDRDMIIKRFGIIDTLQGLNEQEPAIIVRTLAETLSKSCGPTPVNKTNSIEQHSVRERSPTKRSSSSWQA